MLSAARLLWREHRSLFLAFSTALAVTVFFAARMVFFTIYWADPAHHDQPLEGWMTPRYVAHSYDLPPELVREALELEPEIGKRRTLAEIARESNLTLDEIALRITKAAEAHHGAGE